jgi:hypothetical protein
LFNRTKKDEVAMKLKHMRISKQKRAKTILLTPKNPAERTELDRNVFDLVLRMLFENSEKNALDLQKDIFDKSRVKLPSSEMKRLWDVLTGSGWVMPSIGFGKAGRIELSKAGYQMMSQFGNYSTYLASVNNNQPQTIILPIQVESDEQEINAEEVIKKIGKFKGHK